MTRTTTRQASPVIVDTSVLVAIVKREHGHEDLLAAMPSVRSLSLSAASFVELSIVLRDRMPVGDDFAHTDIV